MTTTTLRSPGSPATRWFADLRINGKIGVLVAVLAVVALGVGVIGINRMGTLNDELTAMKAKHLESMADLLSVEGGLADMYREMLVYSISATAADKATAVTATKEADQEVDSALDAYAAVAAGSATRQAAVATLDEAFATYRDLRNVLLYRESPPSGFTMPADVGAAFEKAEGTVNDTVDQLKALEKSEAEQRAGTAASAYSTARTWVIVAIAVGLLLALLLAYVISSSIKRQVTSVRGALRALAANDLTQPATVYGRDEIGDMAIAVNEARDGLRHTLDEITATASVLATAGADLSAATQEISAHALEAAAQADVVASAAGQVSANVSTVAAGSQEMGASIREISQNANDAVQVAAQAVGVAEVTNRTVSKLGESSAEIGNVVKTITAIAEQTNLLALNATIEAARAGETGKGFAVVAGEVKDLAQETAKATEDISRRVEAIQADTSSAVDAIAEISRIIARINEYQVTIASAVEEQTATTGEMTRSVGDASGGTTDIATNIAGVASAAQSTTAALTRAGSTVQNLERVSSQLQVVVGRFRL
ncbi:methyl-accepting chemotaxis protein [Paractinoplanes deccanensis]|uniref:Methyl-accepting chemotaxis protein n=1 Tax=Paractinoplanes deccanensis TaxID=113561 RepID=A0ABQ3YHU3_9ACTN|nr:methyl-accepting chemotaxis protein [Actinoplanes deccanensis]GID79589.1 methyl-accepting chemotaxis protein [Actinoplanes deccanensis]